MRSTWHGILRVACRGTLLRRTDMASFIAERLPAPCDPIDELLALADVHPLSAQSASTPPELEVLGLGDHEYTAIDLNTNS